MTQKIKTKRVLGIDPGTLVAGFGLIDCLPCGALKGIATGTWQLGKNRTLAERLALLATEMRRVLEYWEPTHLCLELAFMARNARSALFLGHARGVILAECQLAGLVIHEMSATAAKKKVTNFGRADKQLVALSLENILDLKLQDLQRDATDALALAYAYAQEHLQTQSSSSVTPLQQKWAAEHRKKRKTTRQSTTKGWEKLLEKGR